MRLRIFEFGLPGNLCEDEGGFIVDWVVTHLPILPLLSLISIMLTSGAMQLRASSTVLQYYAVMEQHLMVIVNP